MEKNIIAQWFVKNMELHFCLSKWKTESIVCALIYPNAHLSEKIEFLPCINNSTHYATYCKPKIRPFAVMGCELTDVWFAYSLQLNNCFLCYSLCYCCCFCCWLLPCYCYCCGGCWLLALQSSKLKNLASNWNTLRSMEMFTIRSTVNAICNYNSENSNFNFSVKHSNYYWLPVELVGKPNEHMKRRQSTTAPHKAGLKVKTSNGMQTVQIIWLNFTVIEMQNQWHRTSTERKLKQRKHA